MEADLIALNQNKSELEQIIKDKAAEIGALRSEISSLEINVKELTNGNEIHKFESDCLNSHVKVLEADLISLNQKKDELQQNINEKDEKIVILKSEISSLKINVKELKNEYEKNKIETDGLNSQIKKLDKSVGYHSKKSKDLAKKINVEKETFKNSNSRIGNTDSAETLGFLVSKFLNPVTTGIFSKIIGANEVAISHRSIFQIFTGNR